MLLKGKIAKYFMLQRHTMHHEKGVMLYDTLHKTLEVEQAQPGNNQNRHLSDLC